MAGMIGGFEPMDKPDPNSVEILKAFLAQDHDCVGREYENENEASRAYVTFYNSACRNNLPVKVSKYRNVIRLIKED